MSDKHSVWQDAEKIERLNAAVEQSIDGIAILEIDDTIAYVNRAFAEMHDYNPDELLTTNVAALYAEEETAVYIRDKEYLKKYGSWSGEIQGIKKGGSRFPVLISTTLLKDANSKPDGILLLIKDITNLKKLEDKLQEVDRLKSEFIANTSHELRTPLQSVTGFTKLLLSGRVTDPKKQEEFLKIIDQQGEHLVMLIDDLIDVQRLELGRFHVEKKINRLSEIVNNAISELSQIASERNIGIAQQVDSSLPDVEVDGMRVKQVIVNLLSNAIKFSKEDSTIWLKAERLDDKVLVQVIDRGIGIPKTDFNRIFERFHQVDGSPTRRVQGTGLGLYIVKQIVEAHNGRVWVESEEGIGSTFYFTLPIKSNSQMKGASI